MHLNTTTTKLVIIQLKIEEKSGEGILLPEIFKTPSVFLQTDLLDLILEKPITLKIDFCGQNQKITSSVGNREVICYFNHLKGEEGGVLLVELLLLFPQALHMAVSWEALIILLEAESID